MSLWRTSVVVRKRSNLAVVLVSVLLVGYIGFLVVMNYHWQVRLRESNLEKARYKVKEYAAVSRYFFSERKQDLRNLAESRELAAFFENKALGMSMDYGLRASLFIISRSFKRFASNRRIDEHRIYTRIVFIDKSGKLLLDTSEDGEEKTRHGNWATLLRPGMHGPEILIIEGGSLPEMVVSASYEFKNQYAGQIVAWISPEAACHLIGPPHGSIQPPVHIVYNGHIFPSRPQRLPETLPERLRDLGKLGAGRFYPFYLPGPGGARLKMLAASYPIQGTPLSLLALSKASDIQATQAPWNIPLATGIIAVFILGGAAIIFRITAKNAILNTRLEETSRAGKEMEDKNRQLEVEIAHRTRAEENLRREKAVSDALAKISNAILLPSSIEEISFIVLDHANALTKSKVGYAGYIDPDTGHLVCPTLLGEVWESCHVRDKDVVFKDFTGLWGWVLNNKKSLMTNAPASDPRASGTPEGHITVERFLSVPALFKGNLLGQVSVANAEQDYTEEDIRTLEKLSTLYAIAIQRRLDEELLRKATIDLEETVRERTAELRAAHERSMREIEDRKKAEEELVNSEKRMRHIIEAAPIGIRINKGGRYAYVNEAFVKMFGYEHADQILGMPVESLVAPEYRDVVKKRQKERMAGMELPSQYEVVGLKKGGERFDMAVWPTLINYEGEKSVLGFVIDTSEEKRLMAQFLQSQKLEVVGRLAGGIAHDFNNLLTTVIGTADLMMSEINKEDRLFEDVQEIKKAGERAASLTRQLLAFSRKQVLKPKVLDLNEVIAGMEKMLRRMIGEDIEIERILEPELGKVKVDPTQIGQVIMNLAVNARDAMPMGGKITIRTANVDLDESYAHDHALGFKLRSGPYVKLSLSDTGIGMDRETREQIFEPFFTTKEEGKGTGLGLSTVYGIIKQSSGYIWCYSEPGQGTSFRIYLPRVEETAEAVQKKNVPESLPRGSETILVVEDNESLRNLATKILKNHGYTVLEAQDGAHALDVCNKHEGSIELLLSDLVMPGMSGVDLQIHFKKVHPGIKVILMSGYLDDALARYGLSADKFEFIQKPFTPDSLAKKVREVLDSGFED